MGRLTLILLLLTASVSAQAPSIRVNAELTKQLTQIADSQRKLTDEFVRLENIKLTIKYRACLEAKMDAVACDSVDLIADGDGFVFKPRPVEKPAEKKP